MKQISQFCKHKSSTSAYHIPHLPLSISLISLILNSDCESVVDYSNRYTIIFSQESKLRESIIHTMESLCKSCSKANESIITELLYHLKMNKNTTILYALIAILVDKDVFHRIFCMKGGFSLLLNQLYNAIHNKIPDGFASCATPSRHKPETSTSFENSTNVYNKVESIKLLSSPIIPNLDGIKTKKQKHLKYLCLTPSSKNILGYIFYAGGRSEVLNHISQIKSVQRLLIVLNKSNNFNLNIKSLLYPSESSFNLKDDFDDDIQTPGGVNPSIIDNKRASLQINNNNNSRKEMKTIGATISPITDRVKSRSHLITSRTTQPKEDETSLTVVVTSHILLAVSQILRVKRDGFNLYSNIKELSTVSMINSIDFCKVIPHCVYCDGFMEFANKDEEQVSFISSARSFDDNNVKDKKEEHDNDERNERRRASIENGVDNNNNIINKELSIGDDLGALTPTTPNTAKSTPTPKPFIPPLALDLPSDNYSSSGLYGFQQGYAKIAGYTNATTTTTNTTTTKTCLLEEIAYEPPLSYTPYLICQNPYYVLFDLINENEITENPICRQLIYDILLNYKKEVVVTRKQIPSELLEGKEKSKESEVVTIKTTQSSDIFIISLCNQIERYCKAIQISLETSDQAQTSRSRRGCPIHLQFQDSKIKGVEEIFRSNVKHLTTIFHILNEYCSNLYSCLNNSDLNPLINVITNNYHTILDIVYLSLPCHHGNCGKECDFDDIFYFIPIFSIIQFPFLCCFGLAIPTPVVTLLSTIKTISGIGVSIITTIVDFYSWGDIESNEYLQVYIKSIIKYLILYFECNASATYHYLEYNPSRVESKYSELKPLIVDQYSILFNLCSLQTKHILSLSSVLISFLDLLIECLSINVSLCSNYDDLTGIVNTLLSTFFSLYSLQTKSDVSTTLCIKFLECLNKMIVINNDTIKKIIKEQHVLDSLIKEISYLTDIPTIIQDCDSQIAKYKKKRLSASNNNSNGSNNNGIELSLKLSIPAFGGGGGGTSNQNITAERAITLLASNKKIFKNTTLHAELLTCLFLILIDKENFCLNPLYTSQFPNADNINMGIDYLDILTNHVTNTDMIPILQPLINNLNNYGRSYYILLRLLTSDLFHTNLFTNVKKISSAGRYGTVYSYDFVISSDYGIIHPVAVKMVSTHPKSGRNALFSIYPEVSVMYRFKGHHEICQLIDYGVHHTHFWIVMESCLMSVRDLILKSSEIGEEYKLMIFLRILYCVQFLHNNNIIHGDIKCANILIRNHEFNKPSSICITDFGSCMSGSVSSKKFVTGTECIRSPEMIKEKLNEITISTDIWSLGCLFYELMSGGDYLYVNGDASKVNKDGECENVNGTNFQVLLQSSGSVIPSEKEKKLNNKSYIDFINYVCNRNPKERPNINDVINRFDSMFLSNFKMPSLPLSIEKSLLNVKKSKPGVGAGVGLSLGHGTNFGIEKYDESLIVWITRNIAVTSISNVTPNLLWKNHFAYCIHICTNPNCHHSFDWITTLLWRGLIELYYRDCQTTEDLNSICEQIRLVTRGGGSVLITITPFVISALYTILYYHLVKHYFMKPIDAMLYLMTTYDPFYGNIHIPSELLCSTPVKPLDDNYIGYYWNSCTCHGILYILNISKNKEKNALKKREKVNSLLCDCTHHCRSCRYTKRLTLSTNSKAKWLLGEMDDILYSTKDEIQDGKYVYKSINLKKLVEYENGKGTDKTIGNSYKIYSCKHCSCPVIAVHSNGHSIGFYANNCIYYESNCDIEIPFFKHLNI